MTQPAADAAADAPPSAEMITPEEASPGWFGPAFRQATAAGGISMLLHMALIVTLGLWMIREHVVRLSQELVATVSTEPEPPVEVPDRLDPDVTPATDLAAPSTSPALQSGAQGEVSVRIESQLATRLSDEPTAVPIKVGDLDIIGSPSDRLAQAIPQGAIKGEALAVADDYSQALDRITHEIVNKLAHGKVLVVWLMDESESMIDDRQEIMSRIGRVYEELGLTERARGDALLTAVASYGQNWTNHLQVPTFNIDAIVKAMSAVATDTSGLEVMCPAISQTIDAFRPFTTRAGPRQMMLVVVTDESGDAVSNHEFLEKAVADARAANCPVYFLGREAVFGYPYAHMRYVDAETKQVFLSQVDRGPETAFPEQLQIDGLQRRWDALPSGFGPYEQCRLARETGGIFFMLPSPESALVNRDPRQYGSEFLRPYAPDLSARAVYAAQRDDSEYRRVLWKIITDLNPYAPNVGAKIEIQLQYPVDVPRLIADLRREILEAQRLLAYLGEAQAALERVQPLRDRDANYRWGANYDLMLAQVIAYQVRLHEFVAYAEVFAEQPPPIKNKLGAQKPTNAWQVRLREQRVTGDRYQEQIDRAATLYQQVLEKHQGTPWAARAEWELSRPYGFEFEELYVPPGGGPGPVRRKL